MGEPSDLIDFLRKRNLRIWASEVAHLVDQNKELDLLRKRIEEAEAANELDRSRIPAALTELHAAIRSRDWVLEGRGSYEWDDDDYRAEFSLWVRDVTKAAELFAHIAADWHGCPLDQTAIRHARAMLYPTPPAQEVGNASS